MARSGSRRWALTAGGVVLGLAAVPATGLGQNAPIQVQAGSFSPPATDLQSFYPGNAMVRQGDSLTFRIQGFHTVTFLPRLGRLPSLVAPTGGRNAELADAAGQPFWWAGTPELAFSPRAAAPTPNRAVTGRSIVSSGLPQGPNPRFTVTFPRTGTFQVRCITHPKMSGRVTVLPREGTPPGAAEQRARARAEQAADRVAAARRVAGQGRVAGPRTVLTGVGTTRFSSFVFLPEDRTVSAGTVLNFRWAGRNEVHTVTFGPAAYLSQVGRALFGDTLGALAAYPSEPPAPGPAELTPTNHGNGFLNSGILTDPGVGPGPHGFRVRFSTPGAYRYMCLIHPDTMAGTITVT